MRHFKLLVCCNDQSLSDALSGENLLTYRCDLVAKSNLFAEAMTIAKGHKIDAVIVEEYCGLEALYEFIDEVSHIYQPPYIVVVSRDMDSGKRRILNRLGAEMCCDFGVEPSAILENLVENLNDKLNSETSVDKVLEERLATIFIASGIPPHIKGYQFLKEAVKQSVHTPSMVNNITKQLYPAIADKFNTSPSKVERAIRHAIEVAWSRGKIENINAMYGIKVFSKEEKPTNGELIALVSDKLIIECS